MNIERNFEKGNHYYNNLDQIVGIIIWKINLESFTDIINIYKMIPSEYFEESTIEKKKDAISIFKLGHLYFYGEKVNQNPDIN